MTFRGTRCACQIRAVVQNAAVQSGVRATRVLVVDDDLSIRRLIVAALKREGYDFLEAQNGREALDLMRSEHPDLVVLDLMMPVLSGWDVLQERLGDSDLSRIPVIIVSANREPELVNAIDKGICAFLPKPFDIAALTALVRACVSRP
jgi:DNA-binding response OmpR family regulator